MRISSPAPVVDLVERCGPLERPQGHGARDRNVFLSGNHGEEQPSRAKTPLTVDGLRLTAYGPDGGEIRIVAGGGDA